MTLGDSDYHKPPILLILYFVSMSKTDEAEFFKLGT